LSNPFSLSLLSAKLRGAAATAQAQSNAAATAQAQSNAAATAQAQSDGRWGTWKLCYLLAIHSKSSTLSLKSS